ncbi:MAG: hypothetical protein KA793_06895 [Bacteroidales bacterium]|nr:hypothetical protein [Bacteroidales bacterium]
MNKIVMQIGLVLLLAPALQAQRLIITPYEQSEKTITMTYDEILRYSRLFDSTSNYIKYVSIGKTGNGYDIPLLIYDASSQFDPVSARKAGKAVLLIQAGVHAGEPDGTDAGMMLFRNLSVSRKILYRNTIILFLPSMNPEGCLRRGPNNRINQNGPVEMGWRTNASNQNLNRDYLKAESPEIKAFLKLFNAWMPDLFIDCHTTDGADYQYVMTYDLTDMCLLSDAQNKWQSEVFMQPLLKRMREKSFPMFRYVTFKNWHDPKSGLVRWIPSPVLSEGYAAARNRPGLLLETHMLKPYGQRVDATLEVLIYAASILDIERETIIRLNNESDLAVSKLYETKTPVPVDFNSLDDSVQIDFEGVEYTVVKSRITGGDWFQYSDTPAIHKVWFYHNPKPSARVELPAAYIFEPAWQQLTAILDAHGIKYTRLYKEMKIPVEAYRFNKVKFASEPYEGRQRIVDFSSETINDSLVFPAGSIVVETRNPNARLLAYLFEPVSPASLVRWGFFNAVFEQKEYAESYVMEPLIRSMLKSDPYLTTEFNEKMQNDKEFASNAWAIQNWFYNKTKYRDTEKNIVPVYRINEVTLRKIQSK